MNLTITDLTYIITSERFYIKQEKNKNFFFFYLKKKFMKTLTEIYRYIFVICLIFILRLSREIFNKKSLFY